MKRQRTSSSAAASARARRDPAAASPNTRNRVVSIDRPEKLDPTQPRLIARDAKTQRIIIAMGSQRIAFDFTTRITRLEPHAGDAAAPVLSFKRASKGKNDRKSR